MKGSDYGRSALGICATVAVCHLTARAGSKAKGTPKKRKHEPPYAYAAATKRVTRATGR